MNYLNCNIVMDVEGIYGTSKIIYSIPFFDLHNNDNKMIQFVEQIHISESDETMGIDFFSNRDPLPFPAFDSIVQAMQNAMLGSDLAE